jgi:hypothetical protein
LRQSKTSTLNSEGGGGNAAPAISLKGVLIMKIICTRNVVIGGEHYDAGDKADVSNEVGIKLINMSKAKPYEEPKKSEDRAVGLTTKSASSLLKRIKKDK